MQKEVTKVAKLYKNNPKAAKTYVTKLAKTMTQKELNNSDKLFNDLFTVQMDNINDRNGGRMTTFVADTQLKEAAQYFGYTVKKSGTTYKLTKGNNVYELTLGDNMCKATIDGEVSEIELAKAPYMDGKTVYVPLDFIRGLK